jgi:hypothetical protein
VHSVGVHVISKAGNPSGNLWVEIWSAGATPTAGSLLATSNPVAASSIFSGDHWEWFTFATPFAQSSGTAYYVVTKGDYAIDNVNYVNLAYSTTSGYANGTKWAWSGSAWSETATQDQGIKIATFSDGGSFDFDGDCTGLTAIRALKGGAAPSVNDMYYVAKGAKLKLLEDEIATGKQVVYGDLSTGAWPVAAEKYGLVELDPGAGFTFLGDGTATNSGFKSSPTTPSPTDSIKSRLILNGTAAKPNVFTNSAGAYDATKQYAITMAYGSIQAEGKYWEIRYPSTINGGNTIAAATQLTDTDHKYGNLTYVIGAATPSHSLVGFPNNAMNFSNYFDFVTLDARGVGASLSVTIATFGSSTQYMAAGVVMSIRGEKIIAPTSGSFRPSLLSTTMRPDISGISYRTSHRLGTTVAWPTATTPSNPHFTNMQDGTVKVEIDNIASYRTLADNGVEDYIQLFDGSGRARGGACSKTRYVAALDRKPANCFLVAGVPLSAMAGWYAKATSDHNTYSDGALAGTITPTLNPAVTDVRFGTQYGQSGTERTGTLVIPTGASAALPLSQVVGG